MGQLFNRLYQKLNKTTMGQGLVETAVIAPLLIFMMLGAFEVGWAVRGYIVLVNINREITRFAVRPSYLDFSERDPLTVGYNFVLTHTYTTLSDQLPLDFDTNSNMTISHMVIDTAFPCDPEADINLCNCNEFTNPASNYNQAQAYTYDDLIINPETPGYEYYSYSFPISNTISQIDFTTESQERLHENNKLNCELLKKGGLPSANNYITTEVVYRQPQLFGFPLISNSLTDPVNLYTRTTMRLIKGARSTESGIDQESDTIGPVCDAYPFILHEDAVAGKENQKVDIFGGPGGNHFGWLTWNPAETNLAYLREELKTSRTPLNDYTNATDANDHYLTVGDHVTSLQGVNATVESTDKLVSGLIGKTIRIPIYDTFQTNRYQISGFVWVRIASTSDINLPGQVVNATYLGDATDACSAVSSGPGPVGSTPTPTPTAGGPTATPTTVPPTATNTPTPTPLPTNTSTATATKTPTATVTKTPAATATKTPTATATKTPMATATKTPTATATKTPTPVATATKTPTPVPALHVQFITVNVVKDSKKDKYRGEVTVTVVDQNGQPVKKVKVYGSWSGAISENEDGDTDDSGQVSETSSYVDNIQGPFQFCVTNIVENGYIYNASANVQTCVSASY